MNLVCAGTIPFDAYYGPVGANEEHTLLTAGNVEFMRNEILKRTPKPVFTANPTALCPNTGSVIFSVQAECVASRPGQAQPGTTYTWTSPNNGLQVLSGQGTASPGIRPTPGFMGTATLQVVAARTGYADSSPAMLSVLVAYSELVIRLESTPIQQPCGVVRRYKAGVNVANIQWQVDGAFAGTGRTVDVSFNPSEPTHTISVSANGLCPVGNLSNTVTHTQSFSSGCALRTAAHSPAMPAVYPNPADEQLTVQLPGVNALSSNAALPPGIVTLYNHRGEQVRRWQGQGTEIKVFTTDLPAGLYFLTSQRGTLVERSQLRIEHSNGR